MIVQPLKPPKTSISPRIKQKYRVNVIDDDIEREERNRSHSDKSIVTPYPLNNPNNKLKNHLVHNIIPTVGRPKSKTVGDYDDIHDNRNNNDEFLDDIEVAHKSIAYNNSLNNKSNEEYDKQIQKLRFKCDQLEWNLNSLQTNTDKDVRQITAKMHRVEHDMKTQNELFNR